MRKEPTEVWVFHGAGARHASGVFATRADAESWIARNHLTGLLTAYPVGVGVYEWALESGAFKPKRDEQRQAHFIGTFTSGAQEHYHFENGRSEGEARGSEPDGG